VEFSEFARNVTFWPYFEEGPGKREWCGGEGEERDVQAYSGRRKRESTLNGGSGTQSAMQKERGGGRLGWGIRARAHVRVCVCVSLCMGAYSIRTEKLLEKTRIE